MRTFSYFTHFAHFIDDEARSEGLDCRSIASKICIAFHEKLQPSSIKCLLMSNLLKLWLSYDELRANLCEYFPLFCTRRLHSLQRSGVFNDDDSISSKFIFTFTAKHTAVNVSDSYYALRWFDYLIQYHFLSILNIWGAGKYDLSQNWFILIHYRIMYYDMRWQNVLDARINSPGKREKRWQLEVIRQLIEALKIKFIIRSECRCAFVMVQ